MTEASVRDWLSLPLLEDEQALALEEVPPSDSARLVPLDEAITLLACPDSRAPLISGDEGLTLPSGEPVRIRGARPVLLPHFARARIQGDELVFDDAARRAPQAQYLLISAIKSQGGPQNSDHHDVWYQRHVHRTRQLTAGAKGLLLDIGCDAPEVSRRLFPAGIDYIGLEPSLSASDQFCLCGMAEFLPVRDAAFDNVAVLTSLDHVLDHHQMVEEATRVLRPGGILFLASLVWHANASVVQDTVHFHHFRDWELRGLLQGFELEVIRRYGWKGDSHRYGVYLRARKPT